jgi:membrane-bound lytic murein transglycosylase B
MRWLEVCSDPEAQPAIHHGFTWIIPTGRLGGAASAAMDESRQTPEPLRTRGRLDLPTVVVIAVLLGLGASTAVAVAAEAPPAEAWTLPPLAAVVVEPAVAEPAVAASSGVASPVGRPVPRAAVTWVDAVARVTGIPSIALQAYADATLALAAEQPSCRLGWTTLAAIGDIESGHGTHGGATLLPDGTTSVPILGPALDGRPGFAAIRATPQSTAWHGDPTWDHAVGPMQFLPSTWERWEADGDGDGVDNPNDIDDAALGAARYLCASGADLTSAAGWHAAVLSYNHAEQYAADVLAAADRYAAASQGAMAGGG